MQKKNYSAKITKIELYNNSFLMSFLANSKIDIKPGQYLSILCDGLTLRRPFSVADFHDNSITIYVKKRGKGTEYLSNLKIGDEIDFIAPLGNGFAIDEKKSLLIGAGAGSAPVFFAQNMLAKLGIEKLSIAAFNSKNEIPVEFKFDRYFTIDGSLGTKGSILDELEKIVDEYKPEKIYSCAPHIVLKAIADIGIKKNIETELAMEKVMACGIGVCRGCVIKIKKGNDIVNATVCKDGPVFKGKEIVW